MPEATNPQPTQSRSPDEFHWAVTYLREDIQDICNEIRGVQGRIDETRGSLGDSIDETSKLLSDRIDATTRRIDEKYELLARRLDTRFGLLMTTMVAVAGVIVVVIKH
jgi:peptidoglycan hydrolase CwlO-like protein